VRPTVLDILILCALDLDAEVPSYVKVVARATDNSAKKIETVVFLPWHRDDRSKVGEQVMSEIFGTVALMKREEPEAWHVNVPPAWHR
jgi:hypothetical protein